MLNKVRKPVIAAAGRGPRQHPAASAVQKETFPLVDRDGLTKPIVQIIGEEALALNSVHCAPIREAIAQILATQVRS
jgi:UTP-glucose-1-phosphate uridylyltransferase